MPKAKRTKEPRAREAAPTTVGPDSWGDAMGEAMARLPRPPLMPHHRSDLVSRIRILAVQTAQFARTEPDDRVNLSRAARVLAAVAHELREHAPGGLPVIEGAALESSALKQLDRVARRALPRGLPGEILTYDVEAGRHDTSAREQLRDVCEKLAATFTRWLAGKSTPHDHEGRAQSLREGWSNAIQGTVFPLLSLRMPGALRGDDATFSARVGKRLAETAEQNASKDRVRYRDESRPPRVTGDDVLRAVMHESQFTMREAFGYADKAPTKGRKRTAET